MRRSLPQYALQDFWIGSAFFDTGIYYIDGVHNQVHINVKDGAIAIVESGCPHQDCVHTGYVKESNRPIICAYNAVYIIIEGTSNYDVVVN